MISINYSTDSQFYVIVDNDNQVNPEILSTSELLTSKHNAFKNIAAQQKQFAGKTQPVLIVWDNTLKIPKPKRLIRLPHGKFKIENV